MQVVEGAKSVIIGIQFVGINKKIRMGRQRKAQHAEKKAIQYSRFQQHQIKKREKHRRH